LEDAYSEIFRLRTALAESETARKALEAQVVSLTSTKSPTTSGPPKNGKVPSTYAAAASKNIHKKKETHRVPTRQAASTVARLFDPAAGKISEYRYVYYSIPKRLPFQKLRRLLEPVGLKTSRILDIQYPTARVVSFLLHEDYILEFTKLLHQKGRGGSPLVEFDPCDPTNLKDPKFASLPADLRAQKAREVENLRCLRSLSFVRRSARVSVARSFLRYERINQAQFDAILAEELAARKTPSPSSPAPLPTTHSPEEKKEIQKKRLLYLGFLLSHDAESASLLANAPTTTSFDSVNLNNAEQMMEE
jgi:hypothetical protein